MNATDKELLEMAARAIGLRAKWFKVSQYRQVGACKMRTGQEEVFGTHHRKPWSPLTDDGDALRLAHALGLQLNLDECQDMSDVRTDIVRAAAEIGKSMTKESDHEHCREAAGSV